MDYFIGAQVGASVVDGIVDFDPSTEDSPGGLLAYDSVNDWVTIPAGTTLATLRVFLTWGTNTSNPTVCEVAAYADSDDSLLLHFQAPHPSGINQINDDPDEDFILTTGTWPFAMPESGYLQVSLTGDAGGGHTTDSGFLELGFVVAGGGWTVGSTGWG